MSTPTIKELLLEHHHAMEQQQKRRITEKELAQIIGINDKLYNNVYNMQRKPSKRITKMLADFFEDPRFYDVAGEERPDQALDNVNRNWWKLSISTKNKIEKLIENDKATQQSADTELQKNSKTTKVR
jgi:hypothetical protein